MIYYSKSTKGFYNSETQKVGIPSDKVSITEESRLELLEGQRLGKVISSDANGLPMLIDYVTPPEDPKITRDKALNTLTHDFGDGRIIDTRPKDELNMRNAIEVMSRLGLETIDWVMVDDTKHPITIAELQTAYISGQDQALAIWSNYIPEGDQ